MNNPNIEQTEIEIREECNTIAEFLINKNRAYGDSALNPKRFFAKGEAEELILSRIDDKLNRIFQGKPDGEDPLKDLTGYYILLQIAKKRRKEQALKKIGATDESCPGYGRDEDQKPKPKPAESLGSPVWPGNPHDPAAKLEELPRRKGTPRNAPDNHDDYE